MKLRAARERKRARGERVEGVKPYGHFPAEQHLIEHIRQLRRKPRKSKRLSIAAVAAQLNAEGHRNRAGREWLPQMARHVLKAPERERLFRASISFSGNPGVTSPATLAERRRLT